MDNEKKAIIIGAGAFVAALIAFAWWKSSQPAVAAAPAAPAPPAAPAAAAPTSAASTAAVVPAPATAMPGAATTDTVSGTTASAGAIVAPIAAAPALAITAGQAMTASNGTVTVPAAVVSWFATVDAANQAQIIAALPAMTASDISGLNDIVTNAWGAGAAPTAAQTAFWNTWRTKYHILDGTYAFAEMPPKKWR